MVAVTYKHAGSDGRRPFPRDETGRRSLAALVRHGYAVTVRYDNGQLCTFRRRAT